MVYIINMVEMGKEFQKKELLSRFADLSAEMSLPQMKAGEVWIVGAGPGELGLLSLHGLNALQQADIVLHDSLVSPSLLALAGDAQTEYVGKRAGAGRSGASRKQTDISQRLIELSRAGQEGCALEGRRPRHFRSQRRGGACACGRGCFLSGICGGECGSSGGACGGGFSHAPRAQSFGVVYHRARCGADKLAGSVRWSEDAGYLYASRLRGDTSAVVGRGSCAERVYCYCEPCGFSTERGNYQNDS